MRHSTAGFTLLELLVAIAIILILIAIAMPHYLALQTRAQAARVNAELKSLYVCLEWYYQDYGYYPLRTTSAGSPYPSGLNNLTTPITYIAEGRLRDPFADEPFYTRYRYWPVRPDGYVQANAEYAHNKDSNWYLLSSNGPDCDFNAFAASLRGEASYPFHDTCYNATNGTSSAGNIWRQGGSLDGVARSHVLSAIPSANRN